MIKRLAGCIRQYKRDTILTPLFMVGEVSCECIIPLLTADLINNIQSGCSMDVILGYGLKLFLVAMLSLACGAASGWFCASSSAGFARNLRKDLYYKVQDFSFSNIDRFSTSSLVTRLTTDVANVQQAFMMMTRMAVRAPMMLIFASIMSIRVGKQLAFIFAGIIPVLGFCLYLMAKTAMPLYKAVFKKYDRLNNSVQENVQAMRVVKSFVREDYETQKFTAESDDVRKDFLRAEKILALNSPLMQFCISVCRILISYFAAKLIVQSGGTYLNVGSLASMITYSMQILMGLMMLSMWRFVRFVLGYRRSQKRHPQRVAVETSADRCTHCGRCVKLCPTGAIVAGDELRTDAAKCIRCCACVKGCPVGARSYDSPFAPVLSRNFAQRKRNLTLM